MATAAGRKETVTCSVHGHKTGSHTYDYSNNDQEDDEK